MIRLISNLLEKKKKIYRLKNPKKQKLLAILRVRNEELIIADTLDHLASICDGIICYDDASTDKTFDILRQHRKVYAIIKNYDWLPNPEERIYRETQDRAELLQLATEYQPEWILCADADERYLGDIRPFIDSDQSQDIDAIRIQLFDAYITIEDREPFKKGQKLLNFRKYFGIERRDILMLWRNSSDVVFQGLDSREPTVPSSKNIIVKFYCQHYGKSLSVQHWEDTCDYYINHFPFEVYGKKWLERKGKAIHLLSDFDTELQIWGEQLFNQAKVIHPV
ncbi:glycosyltransferase family 2 protein [Nostoc sp. FACHB-152]|uniref:glycosyltransferase family 2 protein n=1 Tax=unclassified Nostoc TaxID=2593658 RepID=UPI001684E509|nr:MULTISPECIES: glycosyltransferase family 2 protein [unclassified Nostoc]MBD2445880.1 glycosyltransferase family 2 protein [Nostoc sp. FACHB-152]MBD2467944.1 glycosyltransferase family 2 protein [Nostoc sp. FACHB-145]